MLIHKMSFANTKHPLSEFQYMPSNKPEMKVLPVWPRQQLLGVTESSLKSWVAVAKQWPHEPQLQQEGIVN